MKFLRITSQSGSWFSFARSKPILDSKEQALNDLEREIDKLLTQNPWLKDDIKMSLLYIGPFNEYRAQSLPRNEYDKALKKLSALRDLFRQKLAPTKSSLEYSDQALIIHYIWMGPFIKDGEVNEQIIFEKPNEMAVKIGTSYPIYFWCTEKDLDDYHVYLKSKFLARYHLKNPVGIQHLNENIQIKAINSSFDNLTLGDPHLVNVLANSPLLQDALGVLRKLDEYNTKIAIKDFMVMIISYFFGGLYLDTNTYLATDLDKNKADSDGIEEVCGGPWRIKKAGDFENNIRLITDALVELEKRHNPLFPWLHNRHNREFTFEPMYLDPDSYVKNTRGLIFGNVLPTDMVPNEKGELEFSQKNIDKKREILRKEFHQLPSGFTRRFDGSYVIPRGREPKPENDLDPRDDDCSVRYEAYQFPTLEIWAVYSPKRHISFKGAIASYTDQMKKLGIYQSQQITYTSFCDFPNFAKGEELMRMTRPKGSAMNTLKEDFIGRCAVGAYFDGLLGSGIDRQLIFNLTLIKALMWDEGDGRKCFINRPISLRMA